jgi:alkylhydroperoxidase family enzyme
VGPYFTSPQAFVDNRFMPTNYERVFSQRPEVLAAWGELNGAIKAGMDVRRYELATLAAARRLRSSYCCLAHGSVLIERFNEPVREIALGHAGAGLDEVDVAVMDLAERVVDDATSIGDSDLQRLRELGLSETEIMDVVLAAAARCFFSKTLDALGVLPDASYRDLDPGLLEALVVGRPIAEA